MSFNVVVVVALLLCLAPANSFAGETFEGVLAGGRWESGWWERVQPDRYEKAHTLGGHVGTLTVITCGNLAVDAFWEVSVAASMVQTTTHLIVLALKAQGWSAEGSPHYLRKGSKWLFLETTCPQGDTCTLRVQNPYFGTDIVCPNESRPEPHVPVETVAAPLLAHDDIPHAVEEILRANIQGLVECSSVARDVTIVGTWVVTFTVSVEGNFTEVVAEGTERHDTTLETCVINRVASWNLAGTLPSPLRVRLSILF
jgi:hypothetical protein